MNTAAPTLQMRFGAAVLTLRKLTPIKEFPYFAVLIVRPVRNKKCCLTVSDEAFCYGRGLKINIFYDKNLFILAVSLHLDIPKCFKIVTVGVSKI